ncbi:MAG TPA: hypothetical protein VD886_25565 [Herpetosiphonaceae bacterium]|nr:hypothetical protein [Herpetosiphonaceae bacterium]
MHQRPQKINEQRDSWQSRWIIAGSTLALLATILWHCLLPTLVMGNRDDVGSVWIKDQPRGQWMLVRGGELLIVVASCVVLLSSSAHRRNGRRSIACALALAAIALTWFWWGGIVVAGWG